MMTGRTIRRIRGRAGSALVAVLLVMVASSGSEASTGSELDAAKARLATLERQIAAEQDAIARSRTRFTRLATDSHHIRTRYNDTLQALMQARAELAAAQQEYDGVRARLDQRAAVAYMAGPGSGMAMLLGATSLTDLADRLMFLDQVTQADADLAEQAASLSNAWRTETQTLQTVQIQQAAIVRRLNSKQAAMAIEVARQQSLLEEMARSRAGLEALVEKLTKRLSAEEMAAAGRSLLGAGTAPYGEWARMLLESLGAPTCPDNLVVMVAWETAEGTAARWNPLATTLRMPGSTSFNSVGVQSYVSLEQGLRATVLTLRNGAESHGYGAILSALASCADATVTGQAINASDWCPGCVGGRYVIDIIPAVEAYYDTYANR